MTQRRVRARVLGRVAEGTLRVEIAPGMGLADGGIPIEIPLELVPPDLRTPNAQFVVVQEDGKVVAVERPVGDAAMDWTPHGQPGTLERPPRIFGRIVVGVIALVVLVSLMLPGGGHGEASRRANCVSNMKQLGIALANYHDWHKTFPPAYVVDADGKPMHSWRALLLPYCEDEKTQKLGEEYRFDEPWNSPHNQLLAAKMPDVFRCPGDEEHPGETNYVAVVGDATVWPGTNAMSINAIGDGAETTIVVVETFESGINWLEPRDITLAQALRGIQAGNRPGISSNHRDGVNVLMADGAVHFLPDDTPPEILRALLTANGGEEFIETDDGSFELAPRAKRP